MIDPPPITAETLKWLDSVLSRTEPAPWTAMIEGQDHESGDSFIVVGSEDDRREDMYVDRDSGPAIGADLVAIAVSRTYLPLLIAEIRRLGAADSPE